MRFKSYINEMSYTEGDIPKLFRVVFDLKNAASSLAKGKLEGVTGISGSKEIVMGFLGVVRDTLLIMPKETEQLNKLSRVMYDNPYYLLQDNMKALARIFQKDENSMDMVIFNLFEYVVRYWKSTPKFKDAAYAAGYFAWYQDLSRYWRKDKTKINGPRDLAKWALKMTMEMEKEGHIAWYAKQISAVSLKDMEKSIIEGLKEVSKIYGDEGEWIVKDRNLKIPKSSKLLIVKSLGRYGDNPISGFMEFMHDRADGKIDAPKNMKDSDAYKWWQEKNAPQKEIVKKYKLDKKYKIIYISTKDFDRIKSKYFGRRY